MARKFNLPNFLGAAFLQADHPSIAGAVPDIRVGGALHEYVVARLYANAGFREADIRMLMGTKPVFAADSRAHVFSESTLRETFCAMQAWSREAAGRMFWDALYYRRSDIQPLPTEVLPLMYSPVTRSDGHINGSWAGVVPSFSTWMHREASRFCTGQYETLPWEPEVVPDIPGQFAHISLKTPGMISFTETPEKGAADRQSAPMKPGRYLARFHPHIPSVDIAKMVAGMAESGVLLFAKTPDEIEHVYVNGPNSCMSHTADHYESSEHPVRVYGAGDLAVAYLKNGAGGISDRALVWPKRKQYGRVYGSGNGHFERLLMAAGFVSGTLKGAKLLRIEDDDERLVCPYIDGCNSVSDHGTHLTIGGDIEAGSTNGLIYVEEDTLFVEDTGEWLPESWVHENCIQCPHTGGWYMHGEIVEFYRQHHPTSTTLLECEAHEDWVNSNCVFSDREGFYVYTMYSMYLSWCDESVSRVYYREHEEELLQEEKNARCPNTLELALEAA